MIGLLTSANCLLASKVKSDCLDASKLRSSVTVQTLQPLARRQEVISHSGDPQSTIQTVRSREMHLVSWQPSAACWRGDFSRHCLASVE